LRVGYLDLIGDSLESYSALFMLQHLALRETETVRFAIRGGTDLLPRAFAASLASKIRYETPVVAIEPGEKYASVIIAPSGRRQKLVADRVICTIPFSVLKHVDISPPFSAAKMQAIDQLPYTSIARIYLQFRRRVWTMENLYVTAATDLP